MHHSREDEMRRRQFIMDHFPVQSPISEQMQRNMDELQATMEAADVKLGATGTFPEGKLTEQDEGEIQVAIGAVNGKVVINFGKPVAWIGFSAQQARQIAESLRQQSYKV